MARISFDYSELIGELNLDLLSGTLTMDSPIYILYGDIEGERIIIDWYTEDFVLNTEDYCELPKEYLQQFQEDKPKLEKRKVMEVLAEMEEWSRII